MAELRYVGEPVPRVDGVEKVTGSARYAGDLSFPDMLHLKLLRSPVVHGVVRRVDLGDAGDLAGVVAVLTSTDVKRLCDGRRWGMMVEDCPVLADGRVRYAGEPTVAVVAETERAAAAALELIDIDYESLPPALDMRAALRGEVRVHDGPYSMGPLGTPIVTDLSRNVLHAYDYEHGNVGEAFAAAEYAFSGTYSTAPVAHHTIENAVAIAVPEGDRLAVYASGQFPFPARAGIARLLGWPISRVRVVSPYVGGSFGSKEYIQALPIAAVAAVATGRPVRVQLSAVDAFHSFSRHASEITLRTAVAGDGVFVARECEVLLDAGAYADSSDMVLERCCYRIAGPYRVPNLRVSGRVVYTTKPPSGSYRGFGATQAAWAVETQLDEIAAALGIEPVEMRQRNLLRRDERYSVAEHIINSDVPAALTLATAPSQARERGGRRDALRGTGSAVFSKDGAGQALASYATLRLHADGSATLLTGAVEMGQGAHTILAQIVAEELDLPIERVSVARPDTDNVPFDALTAASRTTTQMGLAVQDAARGARRCLIDLAGPLLGVAPEHVTTRAGEAVADSGALRYEEVLARAGRPELSVTGAYVPPDGFPGFYEIAAGTAEIAVDEETGEIEVLSYVTATDAGFVINPLTAHGQEEGGVIMALGHVLGEEMRYDELGALSNPDLVHYRTMRMGRVPGRLETHMLERRDGPGPYGSKGLGESSILAAAPAVGNALFRATGVRLRDLPLSPERVWRALAHQRDRAAVAPPGTDAHGS